MASRIRTKGGKSKLQTHDSIGRSLGEKAIQNSILRWLKSEGLLHYRQNAGTLKQGKYRVNLGPKGIPDIIVILPPGGRYMGLEVKVVGRYQNPDQKAFQAQLEAAGGLYKVVRSLNEAQEYVWNQLSLPLPSTGKKTPSASDPWS